MSFWQSYKRLLKTKALIRFGSFFSLILIATGISSFIGASRNKLKKPVISSINPAIGSPEDVLTIKGSNFGDKKGESQITIAGFRITESRYISWSNEEISLLLPYNVSDGLVKVITASGESNPSFFTNKSNIPVAVRADPLSTIPSISSVKGQAQMCTGTVITLNGSNFGTSRGASDVFFSASRKETAGDSAISSKEEFIPASLSEYAWDYWSDNEIRVRIPDGADSGSVYVQTSKGKSQDIPLQVAFPAGKKSFSGRHSYLMKTSVDVENTGDAQTGEITVYLPRPAQFSSQPVVQYNEVTPTPLIGDDRYDFIFQSEKMSGTVAKQTFSATFVVDVYAVDSTVDEKKVPPYSAYTKNLYSSFFTADSYIPSDDQMVIELAQTIAGKEKNTARKARLIYDYMAENFKVQTKLRTGRAVPQDLIKVKSGDVFDFAVIYTALCRAAGIAAVQMGGIIAEDMQTVHPHSWTEIYLENFGWLPVDVALAAGLKYNKFPISEKDESRSFYFGNMDSQHIAFSVGCREIKPSIANSAVVGRPKSYALQNVWEESGSIGTSYSSYWTGPIIVGIY